MDGVPTGSVGHRMEIEMRALIVYESMYGNTHRVAEMIGSGLRQFGETDVVPVDEATPELLDGVDLLVVGGPTHVHGMSRPTTRESAAEAVSKPGTDLTLDPDWAGDGVREWLESLDEGGGRSAAAFDTRIGVPQVISGRASKGIAKKLRHHGFELVVEPESFLVDKENHLEPGEEEHAHRWVEELASARSRMRPHAPR
jgi:hypothetical protein